MISYEIASAATPEVVHGAGGTIVATLRGIWEYQLLHVQGGAISVGMIVLGLILFFIGFLVARRVSSSIARRLLKRMGATEGGVAAVQALVFYTLLVLFTFFALNIVGVPLTAFTVLGGALAIGVGFGSQNIVNNFISGLILHIERPIKAGDVIEVTDTQGIVEHIGARSTRVITPDNTHIIIPNSAFLEQNVLNWSYKDNVVRIAVSVGVAYGSPTREVERLLIRAGTEHPGSLDAPEPAVRFDSFGESSLDFTLLVWMPARTPSDLRRMQSDLRYRIDELFQEHDITIAFPQRDVHMNVTGPAPATLPA